MKKGDKVEIINYTGMGNNKFILVDDITEKEELAEIDSENNGGVLGHLDKRYIYKERLRVRN